MELGMSCMLVDCFCHGGYLLDSKEVGDILHLALPCVMETDTVKAYRM